MLNKVIQDRELRRGKPCAEAKLALLVRVEAKSGKEAEAEGFLRSALSIAEEEPETVEWFAIKMEPWTFGILDVFEDEAGRAAALMANAGTLLAKAPVIEKCEVLEAKGANK